MLVDCDLHHNNKLKKTHVDAWGHHFEKHTSITDYVYLKHIVYILCTTALLRSRLVRCRLMFYNSC